MTIIEMGYTKLSTFKNEKTTNLRALHLRGVRVGADAAGEALGPAAVLRHADAVREAHRAARAIVLAVDPLEGRVALDRRALNVLACTASRLEGDRGVLGERQLGLGANQRARDQE